MNDYLPSIFAGLDKVSLREALELFRPVDVGPGDVVIEAGEVDASVALVDSGEVAILIDGVPIGRASTGEMIGEMALFGGGLRTATVTAVAPSRLLVLDVMGFQALRRVDHPVATAIEEHALHALTNRLRLVSDRIAALSQGQSEAAFTPSPRFFDRVASAFGSGGIVHPGRMDGPAVLRSSPLFHGVPDETLVEVARHFAPVGARRGHFLCTEGETGDDWFVLASGEVDVVVSTGEDRVERLATLKPGAAFGMCALLQPEHPRMASCVVREKVTGLAMGRLTFAELAPRNDAVGSVLRIAMIRAMTDQLAYANAQLAKLDGERLRHERTARDVEAIMRAAAALESHGDYLGGHGGTTGYLYE